MRDREKKFLELAETRVNKVLEGMRLIGNLSNKRNYDYTDDQIKKICGDFFGAILTQNSKIVMLVPIGSRIKVSCPWV